jgi:glutamyl-tRNA synthetase
MEPDLLRSRIAPTPSGFLHLGNGVNFAITWALVRAAGGVLRLRIDDADSGRARPEFVEDVFRQLDWLGIDWDEGPSGVEDFFRNHSQTLRRDRYRAVTDSLMERGLVYPCTCSRKEILDAFGHGIYPGRCRRGPVRPRPDFALRLLVEEDAVVRVGGESVPLARRMGDFVVWRKDGLPAYQLASLVDDIDHRMNLVVRGADLLDSTAAQLYLASRLDGEGAGFRRARFLHHSLVRGPGGGKLSKSRGSLTLTAMREAGTPPAAVWRRAARVLGLEAGITGGNDLVTACRARDFFMMTPQ